MLTSVKRCLFQVSVPAFQSQSLKIVVSQSRVKVSASLANVGSLAVGTFDLLKCCLSVLGFVSVLNVGLYVTLWNFIS